MSQIKEKEKVPDYVKTNFCELRSVLSQTDWSCLRITTDINAQLKFDLINV